jgi:hypothetical protein
MSDLVAGIIIGWILGALPIHFLHMAWRELDDR